ncbi:MAG: hypothetical protein WA979_10945 [Pacificimonas sp.]
MNRFAFVFIAFSLPLSLTSCEDGLPDAEERQAAREALPQFLEGVARSRRSETSVVAMRWDVDNVVLTDDKWSWEQVQVVAESGTDGAGAETLRYRISLNPAALSPEVPATLTMQSWGLQLQCADVACISREGERISMKDGKRTQEAITARNIARTEWLFSEYKDRDRAIDLVKTALGHRLRGS